MPTKDGRNEEGIAMITAVMVAFVVALLGIVSVDLAIHNSESSGFDRRRTQALAVAEAGIDYYLSHLSSTSVSSVACSLPEYTLSGSPAGTFKVDARFFDSSNNPLPISGSSQCPLAATPASVEVTSKGRALAGSSPVRTMQARANLSPGTTGPFSGVGAIFAQNNINISATSRLGGDQYSDADLYSNGNISLSANSILYGSLYGQGSVTLQANSEAKKDVWVNGSITMAGNARIRGNATSSTSSITLGAQSRVYGRLPGPSAKAGTTISGGIVDGEKVQNSPSPAPPSRPYPSFVYTAADWANAGYTVRNYSNCAQAVTDIGTWWGTASGSNVVRVTGGCAMSFGSSVSVKGNLAIVTDGSVTVQNNARFAPASGTGPWNLHFFVGLSGITPCSFTARPNGGTNSGLNTLVYTHQACSVDFSSNSAIAQGQVIGGTIDIKHSISFSYRQVAVPGNSGGGLRQDVRWKREIVTT